jgi:cardiolipin-specific phospholipase
MPLVDRISALTIPVTFVCEYSHCLHVTVLTAPDGEQDWMDPQGGIDSVERLRQAGNGQGRMYIVNNAGHHGTSGAIVHCAP